MAPVIYEVQNNGETAQDYIIKDFNPVAFDLNDLNKDKIRGKSIDQVRPNIEKFGLIDIFKEVWQTGEPAFYPPTYYEDENLSAWYINRVFKLDSGEIVAIFDDIYRYNGHAGRASGQRRKPTNTSRFCRTRDLWGRSQ